MNNDMNGFNNNIETLNNNVENLNTNMNTVSPVNNYPENSEKGKGSKVGIVILVIILMLVSAVAGAFFGPKFLNVESETTKQLKKEVAELKKENKKLKEEETKEEAKEDAEESKSQESSKSTSSKCYGTYVASTNKSIKYILKEDGTFSAEGIERKGYFVISDNTISLISQKHTVGPEEEDPYYITSDYVISDDCSTIKVVPDSNNSENYILKKQS